jgi:hypothetical protein
MTNRIVLIGAGSANFGLGTLGDILKSTSLSGSTIVLHDINPEALLRVEKAACAYIEEKNLPFHIEATTDRKEALKAQIFVSFQSKSATALNFGTRTGTLPSSTVFARYMVKMADQGVSSIPCASFPPFSTFVRTSWKSAQKPGYSTSATP